MICQNTPFPSGKCNYQRYFSTLYTFYNYILCILRPRRSMPLSYESGSNAFGGAG